MSDSENEEETSTVFKYGDPQFYIMLQAIGTISAQDYEMICREVVLLRMFLATAHGRSGAKKALGRLQDKLDEIDQFVRVALEDANLAEREGELFLADAVLTIKEEVKTPATKFKLPPVDFNVWSGEQEKFFAWMSSVVKLVGQTKMDDGQAQLMILKKIPEGVRNQCEHLTTFAFIKDWLMERYGTDNGS